ncbi:MAG: type II secretion system minor pseudopilin GspK, partial [Legionella sp.]
SRMTLAHDKLYLASEAVTFWALNELNNANNTFTKPIKGDLVAQFPDKMSNIVPQITIGGSLYDLQSRYNINSISDLKYLLTFLNLVKATNPALSNPEANALTLAVRDWISAYDPSKGKDALTSYYVSQKPAYYPSHQLLTSASELRLIKGINLQIYQALEPYLTALPETTLININTASKKVLKSLGNGLNETQINDIMQARADTGIGEKELNELVLKLNLPNDQITIESNYFLSVSYAKMDEFSLVVYSVINRSKDNKKKIIVRLIRQSFNTL